MDMANVVGTNLHRLRTAAGISLADLAAAADISKTTLHSIEQGQGNPTLSTLWALATALRVALGSLLEQSTPTVDVVRASEPRAHVRGDAVDARLLHRVPLRGTVEVYEIDVAGEQQSAAHLPGVQECLVVTHGQITSGPAETPAHLVEGDSIRFDAGEPHVYQGHAQHNRAILLVLYPQP